MNNYVDSRQMDLRLVEWAYPEKYCESRIYK